MIVGVDHVQVAAPPGCEADARRFFGEVLGLTEVEKPAELRGRGGVWFAEGLHVGGALEVLAARLVAAGVDVHWDDAIPGVARFSVEDPWGNRLELVEADG